MIFFANNAKVPEEQRILASIAIGTSYALAQGVRYNDAQKALYWYEKGLLSADERLRAKANYHIGLLYESDCGVEGHLQIARSYFKKAIDQNASVGSKELALFHVARLDEREGKILAALAIYRRLVDEATIPAVREDAQQKLKEIEQRYGHASVYGLEEKRTDPSVYGSPRPGRASAPDEGLYQLQRDQKLQAFLTNPDGSTSSYEPLEDQNTPPRSNDSSSFSDSV